MVCAHGEVDISLEMWNTQDIIHILIDVQEERRSGPWFSKDSVQQYRGIPEQEVGRGRWLNRGREEGFWDFGGVGNQKNGKSFEM